MIEDAPIVKDTRKVRCAISERFGHDIDQYIDYLCAKGPKTDLKRPKKKQRSKIGKSSKKPVPA